MTLEKITIPAGARLSVDHITIRRGRNEPKVGGAFNSVGFNLKKDSIRTVTLADGTIHGARFRGRTRFWATLPDVNNMVVA